MEPIVFNRNGSLFTSSRIVAAKFQKRHADVLRAIDNLQCSKEFKELNFALLISNEIHPSPIIKQQREYLMTRDGFTLLAMGFTGKDAMKFKIDIINEFNKMQEFLSSDISQLSRKDLVKMLYENEIRKERLQSISDLGQKEIE